MRTTLAGVLEFLNLDRRGLAAPRPEDIAVRHIEKGEIPVVPLKSGRLAIRPCGSARSILARVIDEIDRYIVRSEGKVLRPQEMSRSSWVAVIAAGRLAYFPDEVIDMATAEAGPLFHTRDLFEGEGPFDIAAFVDQEFRRRFGFGRQGPQYAPDASPNARHELHVAFALLRGEKVRECVLQAYRDDPEIGKHDLDWMRPLIELPALRGALPPAQLHGLCRVMRLNKLPITSSILGRLLTIMRRLPADSSDVQIDDALFAAGILPPWTVPTPKPPAEENAQPVTNLAARIHALISQRQFQESMDKAKAEREARRISQREFDRQACAAAAYRAAYGYEWPNRVALVVMQRNVAAVLQIFDGPKDWNTDSKRALRDEIGVDVFQCSAMTRRRRLFELCGFSEAEQAEWEAHEVIEKAQKRAERELADAMRQADAVKYRLETGQVMSGREYVDFCIDAGFSQLIDEPRGSARRYLIHDPVKRASRPLRAKDGTLDYARACLAQVAVPVALVA
ncbi:hypothetical protein [Cupriavidus oxalaticus]|nr:hypothetical protein [Cupriavidus oxalaticus]